MTLVTQHDALQVISTEIARDGGASLVTMLKDYVKLDACLGSVKLLSFLEQHQDIFHVDRQSVPHFCKLISREHVMVSSLQPLALPNQEEEESQLRARVVYVMRRRNARLVRRQILERYNKVNIIWLVKECSTLLHHYLRATGYYLNVYSNSDQVIQVGTEKWQKFVLPAFRDFLVQCKQETILVFDEETEKAWLTEEEDRLESVQQLSSLILDLLHEDGGNNVSLGLLLFRNSELKACLGGRDLDKLVKDHPHEFHDLIISKEGTDLYLQSKRISSSMEDTGRMLVDETGLFSIASSKWGTAMVQTLKRASIDLKIDATVAIDLTASVGGFTLALSKAFSKVIAVEIDLHRANLCRQNMMKHKAITVQVRNADSVLAIPELSFEIGDHPVALILDPPWGGIHYKREKPPIAMGPWSLEDVVERVMQHFSGVLGIRVPVNFTVDDFLSILRDDYKLIFDTVSTRKLGPQLFVILAFSRNNPQSSRIPKTQT